MLINETLEDVIVRRGVKKQVIRVTIAPVCPFCPTQSVPRHDLLSPSHINMHLKQSTAIAAVAALGIHSASAHVARAPAKDETCRKTSVAIL